LRTYSSVRVISIPHTRILESSIKALEERLDYIEIRANNNDQIKCSPRTSLVYIERQYTKVRGDKKPVCNHMHACMGAYENDQEV
jgi:hypothetical protein